MINREPLDPIRRKMLADMGIDVWSLRESPIAGVHVRGDDHSEPAPVASSSPLVEPAPSSPAVADVETRPSLDNDPLSVTYLVSRFAAMLIDNSDVGVSRRLCKDLLASATGDWDTSLREITFSWPVGGSQADGWRAFKAFVEKQLADTDARLVLCSAALARQLAGLKTDCELLVMPAFADFDAARKRTLWCSMQALGR